MTESKIQSRIMKCAKQNGWHAIKTIRLSENGHADIFMFKNGKTVFVEVKTEKGIQSEIQKYRQKQMIDNGFEYFLVRSLEDFKAIPYLEQL